MIQDKGATWLHLFTTSTIFLARARVIETTASPGTSFQHRQQLRPMCTLKLTRAIFGAIATQTR